MKKVYFFKKRVFAFVLLMFAGNLNAQELLGWYFNAADGNTATTGQESSIAARIVDPNIVASTLIRGEGLNINATSYSRSFMSLFPQNAATTRTASITANTYVQFTLQPKTGYKASLTTLTSKLRTGSTSISFGYQWAYSTDGFVTAPKWLGANLIVKETIESGNLGVFVPDVDLSTVADLQNISPDKIITFRLYIWGTQTADRTFTIGQSANITTPDVVLSVSGATTTLPVTMLSFTGDHTLQGNQINWETASEKNSDYFEIFRSAENNAFVSIGTKKAQGNASTRSVYTFTDRNAPERTIYYKLKQVDIDGNSVEYGPIAINSAIQSGKDITVSFNEATNELLISVANENQKDNGVLMVSDIYGRKLQNQRITSNNGQYQAKLTCNLDEGKIYLIALKTGKHHSLIKFAR